MSKQRIAVTWEVSGYIEVENANSLDEAMKEFSKDPDKFALPDGDYVDGSFRLVTEDVEEMKECLGM